MILFHLLVLNASLLNSFENIYRLLDNQSLLKQTCKFISQIHLDDPICVLDETVPTKKTNIILYLYLDHLEFVVYKNKAEPESFKRFYNDFEWSSEDFTDDVCSKLIDTISNEFLCNFKNGNFDLFVEVFPENKSIINTHLDNIKITKFIGKLLYRLSGLSYVEVRVINNALKTFLSRDQKFFNFYKRDNENKVECYILPNSEFSLFDVIFENTEYHKQYKKIDKKRLNYISGIFDTENNFVNYCVNKISKNGEYTDKFFNSYLESNIKFDNNSEDLLSCLIYKYIIKGYSLLFSWEFSKDIENYMNSKKLSDILDIPAIKYGKSNPDFDSVFEFLWQLNIDTKISPTQYLNGIDDFSMFMLTGIHRLLKEDFYSEFQNIFKNKTRAGKLKEELRKFLIRLFDILRMKMCLYVDMCVNVNEARSHKYFLTRLEQVGLRSYDEKQLKKDFAYILRKKPEPRFTPIFKNSPVITFNRTMLDFLYNEIKLKD